MGLFARLFGRSKRPVIARLKPADADDVAFLHGDNFDRGWSVPECENLIADATCYGVGAQLPGEKNLCGFLLCRIAADEAEILSIAVARHARERGIAKAMLARGIAGLGVERVRSLFLEVEAENLPALKLYRHFGFEEVGRRPAYYRKADGSTAEAIVMRRNF
jgi:ribosomal-protein-alanine N-acetyltransferase